MSLSFEELQNTLSSTIIDMQKKFEEERVGFKNKIKSLEDIIFQKEQEIEELKEKLVASKKKKDNTEIIDRLNMEKELIQKELEVKITEFKSALINNSTLNNQLELEKQTTMQLHLELKLLNEKLKNAEQKCEDLQKTTNNQIFFFEKEIEEQKKDILNYQTELENKNISIDYLNNQIKDLRVTENNYKSSLNFFNELREKEELLKKEKEELKNEREKFNEEIIRKKNEKKKKI